MGATKWIGQYFAASVTRYVPVSRYILLLTFFKDMLTVVLGFLLVQKQCEPNLQLHEIQI